MRPILFNNEMVKAILDERKTVTRRIMKIQPWDSHVGCKEHKIANFFENEPYEFACRICGCGVGPEGHSLFKSYVKTGDILYVRETWSEWTDGYVYKTPDTKAGYNYPASYVENWHPSIHMPKEAARIFLRVTGVKVEKLQEMETPDDCNYKKEGVQDKHDFIRVWDGTIKESDKEKYGWYANPWVWVIEFERINNPELLQEVDK